MGLSMLSKEDIPGTWRAMHQDQDNIHSRLVLTWRNKDRYGALGEKEEGRRRHQMDLDLGITTRNSAERHLMAASDLKNDRKQLESICRVQELMKLLVGSTKWRIPSPPATTCLIRKNDLDQARITLTVSRGIQASD